MRQQKRFKGLWDGGFRTVIPETCIFHSYLKIGRWLSSLGNARGL